jgi:UrcA family protein
MKQILAAIFVAALATTAFAAPAAAETAESRSVVVHFGDLDPARTEDAALLLKRIDRAARRACGGRPAGAAMLTEARGYRSCVRKAVAGAVDRLAAPVVSALYNERSGRPIALA